MFEWFKLFPPYLTILTIVLVIIPTILAILLRLSLYNHLRKLTNKVLRLVIPNKSQGIQPSIVHNLEARFREASQKVEQVNTLALIEGTYNSQERFTFFGVSLLCEQWNYFCQVLPNLLLAFGLLGTFLGITLNLYDLSQTINQVNGNDINNLVEKLQIPLQSMGIAFITSLTALVSSSILTIVNIRCNTNLVKLILINSLEDYLDNIVQPTVEGHTRLDKAVQEMVNQQSDFLIRFHDKVGQVLESTIGRVVDRMVEENKTTNLLAREVYERLLESSGTIERGANKFYESVTVLDKQTEKMTKVVADFENFSTGFFKSICLFQESALKIEQSKFSENLEKITVSLAKTQINFSDSTSLLTKNLQEFIESNKKANQFAELFYSQMQDSSDKLQKSSVQFIEAAEKFNQSKFIEAAEKFAQSKFADKLSMAATDLGITQTHFTESAVGLNKSMQIIEVSMKLLDKSIKDIVTASEKINNMNEKSTLILYLTEKRLANEETALNNMESTLNKLLAISNNSQELIYSELRNINNNIVNIRPHDNQKF